jgi:hypothetical protein
MFSLNVSSMDYVCIVATKAVLAGGHLWSAGGELGW